MAVTAVAKKAGKAGNAVPETPLETLTAAVQQGTPIKDALMAYLTKRGHNQAPSGRLFNDVWLAAKQIPSTAEGNDIAYAVTEALMTCGALAARSDDRRLAAEAVMFARPGTTLPNALRVATEARKQDSVPFANIVQRYAG